MDLVWTVHIKLLALCFKDKFIPLQALYYKSSLSEWSELLQKKQKTKKKNNAQITVSALI